MRFGLLIAAVLLLLPQISFAQSLNAGFVQGLWYSDEPIFHGETARIYVALRNSTDDDITAVVEFYDNGELIGDQKISALSGRLIEAWADWDATYGTHTISASLKEVALDGVGSDDATATVTSPFAEDTITIDRDTDSDGIGNEEDQDDDDDGISDDDEILNGTDPLVPETNENKKAEDEEEDQETQRISEDNDASGRRGLERFFDEGRVENAFAGVTETITDTKHSLDGYRGGRNARISEEEPEDGVQQLKRPTATDTAERATITRMRIDVTDQGIFTSILGVVKALASGLYTFILYALSLFLGYPAFVEIILLLLILFAVYKTARKLGQRPQ